MMQQLYEWELRCEGSREGYEQALKEGRSEMFNSVIEFMKSEGMSSE